jgi:hypothetical protein
VGKRWLKQIVPAANTTAGDDRHVQQSGELSSGSAVSISVSANPEGQFTWRVLDGTKRSAHNKTFLDQDLHMMVSGADVRPTMCG